MPKPKEQPKEKFYLLAIWGDLDPEVLGPYKTGKAQDKAAKKFRKEHGDQHGVFHILHTPDGLRVGTYSNGFFEEE